MTVAVVRRWGDKLAIALPDVLDGGFVEGEAVEIVAQGQELVIRRAASLTIGSLFAGRTDEEWRALYAEAFDWGPDVGREHVDE